MNAPKTDEPGIDEPGCQLEDVAAYLDGELSGVPLETFEAHLKTCPGCVAELRAQRHLLCTLDFAFNESRPFELPHDFTRVVAAHAENDLSGMHKKSERRRAVQLCAILALLSFAFLGAAARTLVFDPVRSFLRVTGSLFSLLWQTVYDAGTGTAVIVRVVGRAIVFGPHGLGLVLTLTFIISISLLSLLIARYHRAQIIE
ncbi:MAG TPA: zf-HC2 domain-containing protein [Pyrinomonadaceae bacterium]|nr:zf-HC2 domain-containing protein [Pyrinomonadaceae bacterium]